MSLESLKYNTQPFRLRRAETNDVSTTGADRNKAAQFTIPNKAEESDDAMPAYVGVGLRLTASITVNKGTVNLGNLIAIGAAAEAEKISGTLVIQSLGISGPHISAAIPIPKQIDSSTIQDALVAIGTIKSKIYDESTAISPRVVAVYNNVGGGSETINRVVSDALRNLVVLDLGAKKTGRASPGTGGSQ